MLLGYKWKWVKADMKKLSVLFILILLISCSLFAKGEIKVQSIVRSNNDFSYTLNQANTDSAGGLFRLSVNDHELTPDSTSFFLVDANIAKEDVSVNLIIKQQQTTRTNEAITISVEAGQLSFTDIGLNQTFSTINFSFTEIGEPSVGEEYLEISSEELDNNTLVFSLKYKDPSMAVERGTTIATFTANWEQNEELLEHPGTYTADLTLKYTVN